MTNLIVNPILFEEANRIDSLFHNNISMHRSEWNEEEVSLRIAAIQLLIFRHYENDSDEGQKFMDWLASCEITEFFDS
jgi:hypothetical protein